MDAACAAVYYVSVGGNDVTWRAEWPAEAVGGRVAKIPEGQMDEAVLAPNTTTALPWRMVATEKTRSWVLDSKDAYERFNKVRRHLSMLTVQFPEHQGTAVFVRPDPARAMLAQAMSANGIRTVAETDDNYFAHNRYNIFARTWQSGEKVHDAHARAMASMDANVFSTAWLRDRYHREYKQRFGHLPLPEMHVCRNNIAREHWPKRQDYDGPVRVGFMGSPSHLWDIHIAYAAFHAAKYAGARTVTIGYNPADPDPLVPNEMEVEGVVYKLRSDKSLAVSRRWQDVIDESVPWITPAEYRRSGLPLDIGLAPLRRNDFTLGKSCCKAIEYTISGAACVLQRHPVYLAGGWRHEVNCLLAKSQEDMGVQTLRLIRDPGLRAELVAAAQEMVATERNGDVMKKEWEVALGC